MSPYLNALERALDSACQSRFQSRSIFEWGGVNGDGLDGEGVHGEGVWCGGGVLCDDRDGTLGYFVHV